MTLLLPLLAFAFVSLLVVAGAMALTPAHAGAIERRLGELSGRPGGMPRERPSRTRLLEALKRIGRMAPKSPSDTRIISASPVFT